MLQNWFDPHLEVVTLEPQKPLEIGHAFGERFTHLSYKHLFETSSFSFFSFVLRPQECTDLHQLPFNGLIFFFSCRSMKSLEHKSPRVTRAAKCEKDSGKEQLADRLLGDGHGLFSEQVTDEELEDVRKRLGWNERDDEIDDMHEEILQSLKEGDEEKTLDLRIKLTDAMMQQELAMEQERTPEGPLEPCAKSPFLQEAAVQIDGHDVVFFRGPVQHNLVNIGSDVVTALLVRIK
ncbi:hypothetical protein GUITHDRAFT_109138 [Guillardia theta CCMP2712]|uniref:Uncharacterized protein n=1 Tax=Guillardia theta (strain CCMP2712) TaxID=905079 RepID=L1J960_GUITC|nr:hypothetical protein GUITHDRAFT_109138 [Guillardia theta CCMP2712]EKX45093.1 hypothetical protein GUITHDRAFT_109138 [Guillardia theta CCMP2712]|eukprot:XP_005832073.1 hypothetical protein GUITHDRAFT_109138 [Guillardia theta CCMP2712]